MIDINPVRKLSAKERKVFDRVVSDFSHIGQTASEMLCRFAEASVRYEDAVKDIKKNPTVKTAVINRSTGNIVGYKEVRNPAFRTLSEAQSQMNALARRLLIDAASENRRLTLLSKKSRALNADEEAYRDEKQCRDSLTEEQIAEGYERFVAGYGWPYAHDEETKRNIVIEWLCEPLFHMKPCTEEQLASGDVDNCEEPDNGL
jgi:phage terminase small subunit